MPKQILSWELTKSVSSGPLVPRSQVDFSGPRSKQKLVVAFLAPLQTRTLKISKAVAFSAHRPRMRVEDYLDHCPRTTSSSRVEDYFLGSLHSKCPHHHQISNRVPGCLDQTHSKLNPLKVVDYLDRWGRLKVRTKVSFRKGLVYSED